MARSKRTSSTDFGIPVRTAASDAARAKTAAQLGDTALTAGKAEAAIDLYQQAIDLDPNQAAVYASLANSLGRAARARGDCAEAHRGRARG